ncbi:DUF2177 family protein [bacterium]|nr:DUF2177 family protein [bacterium]
MLKCKKLLIKIILTSFTMILLDSIWLGFVAQQFYLKELKHLIRGDGTAFDVNYAAAGGVYIVMVVGLMCFLEPYFSQWSWRQTILKSALFGLVVYGVYDLTNLATLRDWPISITILDMAWGAFLYATSASVVK